MTFRNVRLSESIERRANFQYRFNNTIIATKAGFEQRNINWTQFRLYADISFSNRDKEDIQSVIDHFIVMTGSAYSFPVKNWDMYRIGDPRIGTTQLVGVGDNTTQAFQINKLIERGAFNFTKDITKPRAGGKVYVNAVLQTETTDYTIDLLTGIITFVSAPAAAAQITYCGEFDVPMRFSDDSLNVLGEMYLENIEVASLPNIELIEVRGE